MNKLPLLLLGLGTLLIGGWIVHMHKESASPPSVEPRVDMRIVEALRDNFDPAHPGRGLSDYPSEESVDVPKSYAMVLIAELVRQSSGIMSQRPGLQSVAGHWLLDNARLDPDRHAGWGVPVAWDAYGDGSVNPANTVYTISNAIVIEALLDWMEQDEAAPRSRILAVLKDVVKPYLDPAMRSPAGLMPYSLRESDRRYDTFNPAAYMAGQLQRLSWHVTPELGARLRTVADQTMSVLIRERQIDPGGNWYWHYSIQEKTPNDLAHASYIVWGIRTYIDQGGRLASNFDWPRVRDHLLTFDRGAAFIHAWPALATSITRPARLYDSGIALSLSCQEPALHALRNRLLATIPLYKMPEGPGYLRYPVGYDTTPRRVNEYEAYLYMGLLRCAAGGAPAHRGKVDRAAVSGDGIVPMLSQAEGRLRAEERTVERLTDAMIWQSTGKDEVELARFTAENGHYTVSRQLMSDTLMVGRYDAAGREIWRKPVEHSPGGKPIFRNALHADRKLYLVYYDDAARGNFLRVLPDTVHDLPDIAESERLPSVRDPAGSTYEMIPPIFMHMAEDGVLHVVGGATYALRDRTGVWSERSLDDCESVIEAAWAGHGFALLCQLTKDSKDRVFKIVAPNGIKIPPLDPPPAIPWNLQYQPDRGLTVEHARRPDELRRMLAYDLGRIVGQGWMELGIGNTESRIPWSQVYTLNGYLDLIFLSRRDPEMANLFGWLVPAARQRLEVEMRLLDRVWREGHFRTRAFTVDRSPALFAVQTARLLLLMDRYQSEVRPQEPLKSLPDLASRVCSLDGHIETLARSGQDPRWIKPGRAYLRWPRGSKFSFDGLNVPYNHQNEWAYAVLRAGQGGACRAAREAAQDILAYFGERVMQAGRFPASGEWDYWWGQAYDGWRRQDRVSINRPEYEGDHIKAWISFRTIDAMSVLAGLDALPAPLHKAALDSARDLVVNGKLYPFAGYELARRGIEVQLPANVAARYVRVPAPWALQSAVWAQASLARSTRSSAHE